MRAQTRRYIRCAECAAEPVDSEDQTMRTLARTVIAFLALATGIVAFSGCHTIQGAGQDLEDAGQAMEDAVD